MVKLDIVSEVTKFILELLNICIVGEDDEEVDVRVYAPRLAPGHAAVQQDRSNRVPELLSNLPRKRFGCALVRRRACFGHGLGLARMPLKPSLGSVPEKQP